MIIDLQERHGPRKASTSCMFVILGSTCDDICFVKGDRTVKQAINRS